MSDEFFIDDSVEDSSDEVFISYSPKDEAEVLDLVNRLQERGVSVCNFGSATLVSAVLKLIDVDRLKNCKVLMLFCSKRAFESLHVIKEVSAAAENRKPILPVYIEKVNPPPSMKKQLSGQSEIMLTKSDVGADLDQVFRSLVRLGITPKPAPDSPPNDLSLQENGENTQAAPYRGTTFISYRRDNGAANARLISSQLSSKGWTTFLDVKDLGSSFFDDSLMREIEATDNFILVLSPNALERCTNEQDWVRCEIEHAIKSRKNIVPVLLDGFHFPPEHELPESIRPILRLNSVEYSHVYFEATIDKVVSFLVPASG